jgi:phosphoribosylformylglycinamidine cyclo-ligase
MAPTRIYVKPILRLLEEIPGARPGAHHGRRSRRQHPARAARGARGGARAQRLDPDPVFDWLQRAGRVADAEMYRVFNCGIGMTVHVAAQNAQRAIEILEKAARARG